MKRLLILLVLMMTIATITFVGCQKEVTNSAKAVSITTEQSVIVANQTFETLNGITDTYIGSNGLKSSLITCPSISATLNASWPLVISFDWGTGCQSADDGITRSGKISVSLSGKMNVAGSVATFTFTDFVSDGNKISGVHLITYNGLNPNNNWPRYTVFTEAKIEFSDGKFMTYRTEYVRLLAEGSSTLAITDDVWRIEGSASGLTREGVAWTASFPSAVVKKMSCKWFSSGSILVNVAGESSKTINFGDGTCDNLATVTVDGVSKQITL